VPFDQGGRVIMTWDASRLDIFPAETVTHYSVWRSMGEKGLTSLLAGDAILISLELICLADPSCMPTCIEGGRRPRVMDPAITPIELSEASHLSRGYFDGVAVPILSQRVGEPGVAIDAKRLEQLLGQVSERGLFYPKNG
jgi:hypothetical protein